MVGKSFFVYSVNRLSSKGQHSKVICLNSLFFFFVSVSEKSEWSWLTD